MAHIERDDFFRGLSLGGALLMSVCRKSLRFMADDARARITYGRVEGKNR